MPSSTKYKGSNLTSNGQMVIEPQQVVVNHNNMREEVQHQ